MDFVLVRLGAGPTFVVVSFAKDSSVGYCQDRKTHQSVDLANTKSIKRFMPMLHSLQSVDPGCRESRIGAIHGSIKSLRSSAYILL